MMGTLSALASMVVVIVTLSVLASMVVLVRAGAYNDNDDNYVRASSRQHLTDSYHKAPLDAGFGKKWERIWGMSDEFWRAHLHHIWEPNNTNWAGRQPGYFKNENVLINNHHLKLQSRLEEIDSVPENLKSKGYEDFSTAFVRTKNRHTYGYFEISAKLMDSEISSAFWFAYNEPGPNRNETWWTEIDVFEYSTSTKDGANHRYELHTNAHVHRAPNSTLDQLEDSIPYKAPESYTVDTDLTKDFHVYALDWKPDTITWYLDGAKIREIENKYWHRAMALQLDSETFPVWFGLPRNGSALPKKFEIDYVRSWKRVDA